MPTRLIYILECDELDKQESTLLSVLPQLAERFDLLLLTPPATLALPEGVQRREFLGLPDLFWQLVRGLRRQEEATVISHGSRQVLAAELAARLCGTRLAHLLNVREVAAQVSPLPPRRPSCVPLAYLVSDPGSRDQILVQGVPAEHVHVLDNPLPHWISGLTPKSRHAQAVRRIALFSHFEGGDQLSLLLQALLLNPALNAIEFHVYGAGPQYDALRYQAVAQGLNVLFMGFMPRALQFLSCYDAWLQTDGLRPTLATLQAMSVSLPVLVPYSLQQNFYVDEGVSGCSFAAGSARDLGRALQQLAVYSHWQRERMGEEGRWRVREAYGPQAVADRYARAVHGAWRLRRQQPTGCIRHWLVM